MFCFWKELSEERKSKRCDRYARFLKREKLNESVISIPNRPSTSDASTDERGIGEIPMSSIREVEAHLPRLVDHAVQTDKEVPVNDKRKESAGGDTLYQRIKTNEKLLNFHTGLPNHDLFLWVLSLVVMKKVYK